MRRGRLIAVLTAVALCLPAAALASGESRAVVTASVGVAGGRAGSGSLVLAITRNGRAVYSRAVNAAGCRRQCSDVAVPPGKSVLHVVDLDADGEPEVVLGLFTGGANCCFIDQVFAFHAGAHTYVKSEHNFLNAGASLATLNGRRVFRSGDSRITEAGFTDAAKWKRLFDHHLSNGVGLIAAWAADEDLLGRSALVDATLKRLAAQHKLRTPLGLPHHSETLFVTQLQKLLRRLGYTRRSV